MVDARNIDISYLKKLISEFDVNKLDTNSDLYKEFSYIPEVKCIFEKEKNPILLSNIAVIKSMYL